MTPTADEIDDETEGTSRRSRDPETRTLDAILRILEELPNERSKARVMNYLHDRFQDKGES